MASSVARVIARIDTDVFTRRRRPVSTSPRSPNSAEDGTSDSKKNSSGKKSPVITRKPVPSSKNHNNGRNNNEEHEDSDVDDYDSDSTYASTVASPVDTSHNRKSTNVVLDEDGYPRRTGAKKFVGQPTEDMLEVKIGEATYSVNKVTGQQRTSVFWDESGSVSGGNSRPTSSANYSASSGPPLDIPLAALTLTPPATAAGDEGSSSPIDVDFGPTASLGDALHLPEPKKKKKEKQRPVSGMIAESSGSGMQRRSVAWTPGMINFNHHQQQSLAQNSAPSDGGGDNFSSSSSSSMRRQQYQQNSSSSNPSSNSTPPHPAAVTYTPPKPVQGILPPRRSSYRREEREEDRESVISDAQSFVREHVALAQQKQIQEEAIRLKIMQQHYYQHQRSASSASHLLLNASNGANGNGVYMDRRKSRSPSNEPEPQPQAQLQQQQQQHYQQQQQQQQQGPYLNSIRPVGGGHVRTGSAATLPNNLNRSASSDLLNSGFHMNGGNSGGNSGPNSGNNSRNASREMLVRLPSKGNLLDRPAPTPNANISTTAALHSLPPPVQYSQPVPSTYQTPAQQSHQRAAAAQGTHPSYLPGYGKLSAQEQEYIARSLGAPLLGQNLDKDTQNQTPKHKAGLLGQMEKREKEKKDYRNSMAVHQVLRQRGSRMGLNATPQPQQPQQQSQHHLLQPNGHHYNGGVQQNGFGYGQQQQYLGHQQQQQQNFGHHGYQQQQPQQYGAGQLSHSQQMAMVLQQQQQLQQQQMAMMQQQFGIQPVMNPQQYQNPQQRVNSGAWRYN
ncbi:hypothetical protein TWF694_005023 [Orbilia ellipsospora]|uniref:Uncharacterized protein n=1 Tax=Orbilia ellipsospora TaxID=2528407 RepID=A0AAV9WUG8_9PEZI